MRSRSGGGNAGDAHPPADPVRLLPSFSSLVFFHHEIFVFVFFFIACVQLFAVGFTRRGSPGEPARHIDHHRFALATGVQCHCGGAFLLLLLVGFPDALCLGGLPARKIPCLCSKESKKSKECKKSKKSKRRETGIEGDQLPLFFLACQGARMLFSPLPLRSAMALQRSWWPWWIELKHLRLQVPLTMLAVLRIGRCACCASCA